MKKLLSVVLSIAMVLTLVPAAFAYETGTYTGTGMGRNGEIAVSVTFTTDAIESIEVVSQAETPNLSDLALTKIPADVVEYQSLAVDNVAGATFTSMAVKNAIKDAVAQAGGDAAALQKVEVAYPAPATDDLTADIVVIGGGTAGLVAALTAANAGVDVILVEKEDILGGTLNVAAGLLLTVGAETNDPALDDSLERVMNFYHAITADSVHQPDFDFTAKLMSETGKTIDMLNGMGLAHVELDMGNYVGSMYTLGWKLAADLAAACDAAGVKAITGTAGKSLVVDENGAVTGVVVANKAGEYTISAKKVIVATGGASWSADVKASQTQLAVMDKHEKTQIGSTGDGMHMLADIGGQMAPDLYVKSSQPDFADAFHNDWSNTPSRGNTIMINADAVRFANEAVAPDTILNAKMLADGSTAYWNLIDGNNTIGFDANYFAMVQTFAADDNKKVAVFASDLDELAAKLGVDAEALKATVADYNAACAAGEDTAFGKPADRLVAYPDDAGYYAVYSRVGSWGTIGGIIVDEQMHVLNNDGAVIANVFAAGEVATAQLFGDYYFGGFSLGLYTTAGRVAAEAAVAEITE